MDEGFFYWRQELQDAAAACCSTSADDDSAFGLGNGGFQPEDDSSIEQLREVLQRALKPQGQLQPLSASGFEKVVTLEERVMPEREHRPYHPAVHSNLESLGRNSSLPNAEAGGGASSVYVAADVSPDLDAAVAADVPSGPSAAMAAAEAQRERRIVACLELLKHLLDPAANSQAELLADRAAWAIVQSLSSSGCADVSLPCQHATAAVLAELASAGSARELYIILVAELDSTVRRVASGEESEGHFDEEQNGRLQGSELKFLEEERDLQSRNASAVASGEFGWLLAVIQALRSALLKISRRRLNFFCDAAPLLLRSVSICPHKNIVSPVVAPRLCSSASDNQQPASDAADSATVATTWRDLICGEVSGLVSDLFTALKLEGAGANNASAVSSGVCLLFLLQLLPLCLHFSPLNSPPHGIPIQRASSSQLGTRPSTCCSSQHSPRSLDTPSKAPLTAQAVSAGRAKISAGEALASPAVDPLFASLSEAPLRELALLALEASAACDITLGGLLRLDLLQAADAGSDAASAARVASSPAAKDAATAAAAAAVGGSATFRDAVQLLLGGGEEEEPQEGGAGEEGEGEGEEEEESEEQGNEQVSSLRKGSVWQQKLQRDCEHGIGVLLLLDTQKRVGGKGVFEQLQQLRQQGEQQQQQFRQQEQGEQGFLSEELCAFDERQWARVISISSKMMRSSVVDVATGGVLLCDFSSQAYAAMVARLPAGIVSQGAREEADVLDNACGEADMKAAVMLAVDGLIRLILTVTSPRDVRRRALSVVRTALRNCLPADERLAVLQQLVEEWHHQPMLVSMMLNVVKDECDVISKGIVGSSRPSCNMEFIRPKVYAMLHEVLGAHYQNTTLFLQNSDAIIGALNLLRFLLLREEQLQDRWRIVDEASTLKAKSDWLLPLSQLGHHGREETFDDCDVNAQFSIETILMLVARCLEIIEHYQQEP